MRSKGWRMEPARHSLASKGIKTKDLRVRSSPRENIEKMDRALKVMQRIARDNIADWIDSAKHSNYKHPELVPVLEEEKRNVGNWKSALDFIDWCAHRGSEDGWTPREVKSALVLAYGSKANTPESLLKYVDQKSTTRWLKEVD
jgi:hypothetical protein